MIIALASTMVKPSLVANVLAVAHAPRMETSQLSEIRRARLNELLEQQFDGVIQALATKIGRDHAQVWQWLRGTRNISERTAVHIETECGLPAGWLSGEVMLGRIVDEVVSALDRKDVDEIVAYLMFKVQQASTSVLEPERFGKYMKLLSQFKAKDPKAP